MEKLPQEEIELKLVVALPEEWDSVCGFIKRLDTIVGEKTLILAARYFDTVDRDLRKAKIVYRVRKENEDWHATIKSVGSEGGGLHRHLEWNAKVAHGKPDLSVFNHTSIDQNTLSVLSTKTLGVLVETDFERKIVLLNYGNSLIEVAMDKGCIFAGKKKSPILEIELELKEGCPGDLLRLGAVLSREFCLVAEPISKFLRGLLLAGEVRARTFSSLPDDDSDTIALIHYFFGLIYQEWMEKKQVGAERYEACLTKIFKQIALPEDEKKRMMFWRDGAEDEKKNKQKSLIATLFLLWSDKNK